MTGWVLLSTVVTAAIMSAATVSTAATAADIRVMSGGAPKEALAVLIPRFEAQTGHHVVMTYQVISALQKALAAGATPDMVLMPVPAIADLAKADKLRQTGSAPLGTVKLVAIVGKGAPRPDISTREAFRAALLAAPSIVVSTPTATPSGAHMAKVVADLGIADAIAGKVTYRPALEGGAEMVATGKAALGIYPASEIMRVDGVVEAGPLPAALQLAITYGGAVSTANSQPEPALAFIRFLAEDRNRSVWTEAGFDPP